MNNPLDSTMPEDNDCEQAIAPSVPKLSIADLMIWTACVAVIITYFQFLYSLEPYTSQASVHKFTSMGYAMVWGTATACGVSWLRNRRAWLSSGKLELGHYCIMLINIISISSASFSLITASLFRDMSGSGYQFFALVNLFFLLLILAIRTVFIVLTLKRRWFLCLLPWPMMTCWKIVLYFLYLLPWLGFGDISMLNGNYVFLYHLGPGVLSLIGALITMVFMTTSVLGKTKRDWLHWVGISCLLGSYLLGIVSSAWIIFI
ncbi:MAG: hypothetical protein COA78_26605 [Blastopirellula sp.]|nr:MAG: hypothetical protein COA78_26605 [Blastopirellula sp.]